MSDPYERLEPAEEPDVPTWDDQYIEDVSDRLLFNYDLEKDVRVGEETFTLYGQMRMLNKKHFLHPSLTFAEHESYEHIYTRRQAAVGVEDLKKLIELGHNRAEAEIDPNPEHFSTEFVFVVVTDEISPDVRSYVDGYKERTMLKYGYHGHYEIHLVVVAPDREEIVSSRDAHVEEAFRLWTPIEQEDPSWWDLITRRLQL